MLALIVDDEPLARRGVVLRLRKFKDIEVVGQCGDGVSAVEKILELVARPGVPGRADAWHGWFPGFARGAEGEAAERHLFDRV